MHYKAQHLVGDNADNANKGFFEKSLELWLEVKEEVEGIHATDVISSLVDVYVELNEFEKAEKYLKELKSIVERTNDVEIKFWYYVELTKFYHYTEKPENALKSALKELEVLKKMEPYPELESLVLLHVGDVYAGMEKSKNAIRYYLQALEIASAYNLSFMEHLSCMELTKAYYNMGDYKTAVEYANRAVNYFLRVRNYRRAVDTLSYRCLSFIGLKNLDKAEEDAEEMIKIGQSTNYPLALAGYIFLGAVKNLRGENGEEYLKLGEEKMKEYPWLCEAVLEELGRVYNIQQTF